ncbi:hypothetical protein [Halorussus halobius]|uniref:hypothetical protein n=1 Tax=Halorussus halobius TaxID=1710537 RepID=UPI001092C101|nr:hypothetical protein [Halorussus halobius]
MVERNDPGRAGVKAGRVVGLLTAVVVIASLHEGRDSFYRMMDVLLGAAGVEAGLAVSALFWANAVLAGVARYAICYVVGSLVGVLYDWLDRPSLPVLVAVVLVVGVVDGLFAVVDTASVAVGVAYVLAWLCYVPAFVRLFDPDADERSGPVRLGDS